MKRLLKKDIKKVKKVIFEISQTELKEEAELGERLQKALTSNDLSLILINKAKRVHEATSSINRDEKRLIEDIKEMKQLADLILEKFRLEYCNRQ